MPPSFGRELCDLLADPLTECMLAADRLERTDLIGLLERARDGLRRRQTSRWILRAAADRDIIETLERDAVRHASAPARPDATPREDPRAGDDPQMIGLLLERCRAAFAAGLSFRDVWTTILRGHPAVRPGKAEVFDGSRSWIEVRLVTGAHLVYEEPVGYWLIDPADLARRARIDAWSAGPEHARARRYRHKAEELRTAGETMRSDARYALFRLAGTYEQLADQLEPANGSSARRSLAGARGATPRAAPERAGGLPRPRRPGSPHVLGPGLRDHERDQQQGGQPDPARPTTAAV